MTDIVTQRLAQAIFSTTSILATPIELNFTPDVAVEFAANNWPLAIGLVVFYCGFISIGSYVMKSYQPYDLRLPLAAWNFFLCLFSFLGMCRTMPYLIASIMSQEFESTVCTRPSDSWGTGPTGFWVMLFVFSKIPELIDTIFIVLRKKPLIFLHWYHHITVLLFCWSAYSTTSGSGLYFVAMNYSVHAMMYGYYCLQAMNMCPKWFPTVWITLSQILQMFVGTGVCMSAWYFKLSGQSCHNDVSNLVAGALMYGSYLYLFSDFAVRRYIFPSTKSKKGEKKLE